MKLSERIAEALLTGTPLKEWGSASDFRNYRELTAKKAGPAGCQPGHVVKVGDRIGWNPITKKVQCASCWQKWSAENAHARASEMGWM